MVKKLTAAGLAVLFHQAYEHLAPQHDYETRADTKKFDPASPNGKLMVATCQAVLTTLRLGGYDI